MWKCLAVYLTSALPGTAIYFYLSFSFQCVFTLHISHFELKVGRWRVPKSTGESSNRHLAFRQNIWLWSLSKWRKAVTFGGHHGSDSLPWTPHQYLSDGWREKELRQGWWAGVLLSQNTKAGQGTQRKLHLTLSTVAQKTSWEPCSPNLSGLLWSCSSDIYKACLLNGTGTTSLN